MSGKRTLCIAIGLAAAPAAVPALAQEAKAAGAAPASGLTELTDEEMGDMRGRYTVSSNTVAWFGVTMVSTWQTQAGQQLTSSMKVTVDGRPPDGPVVTFQPHVSITAADAPVPTPDGQREIDNSGLANVTGVVQSVQVAGDGNAGNNTAHITIRDEPATPEQATASVTAAAAVLPGPEASPSTVAVASVSGMNAVAQLEDNTARVLLQIDGQGAVEQWINRSGMGQTIQLAADGHQASNWMELDVVRSTSQGRTVLGQNVAQAIALSRGIAIGY
ncbi:hypothetical protein [Pseudoxanthomonas sp. 10H]|uniref:hypothetical protein n=1 Tax=Pseudoxanthomonas sp. 10H TaxID=3242729 RepID=UPI003555FC89